MIYFKFLIHQQLIFFIQISLSLVGHISLIEQTPLNTLPL